MMLDGHARGPLIGCQNSPFALCVMRMGERSRDGDMSISWRVGGRHLISRKAAYFRGAVTIFSL